MKRPTWLLVVAALTTAGLAQETPTAPPAAQGSGYGVTQAYKDNFDPTTVTTFTGKVTGVTIAGATKTRDAWGTFLLKTDKQTYTVDAGPTWYYDYAGFNVDRNNKVSVKGSLVKENDRQILLASRITKGQHSIDLRDAAGVPLWLSVQRPDPAQYLLEGVVSNVVLLPDVGNGPIVGIVVQSDRGTFRVAVGSAVALAQRGINLVNGSEVRILTNEPIKRGRILTAADIQVAPPAVYWPNDNGYGGYGNVITNNRPYYYDPYNFVLPQLFIQPYSNYYFNPMGGSYYYNGPYPPGNYSYTSYGYGR